MYDYPEIKFILTRLIYYYVTANLGYSFVVVFVFEVIFIIIFLRSSSFFSIFLGTSSMFFPKVVFIFLCCPQIFWGHLPFFLGHQSSWVKIRLHPDNQLTSYYGSCVLRSFWVWSKWGCLPKSFFFILAVQVRYFNTFIAQT